MQYHAYLALVTPAVLMCPSATTASPPDASSSSQTPGNSPLEVHVDFPCGSAQVIEVNQQQRYVSIRPTPHRDRGWACWWYFRLTGIQPGETILVEVGDAPWATPDRASFSTDNRHWRHTAPGQRRGKRIAYRQVIDSTEAWFAWGPPFTPVDAARLIATAADRCATAETFELCKTRAGRAVPALKIAGPRAEGEAPVGIWVQARQHAWESGSSWVCRGLVEWLVSHDPRATSLRRRSCIYIVPIMDVDNVTIGAGGKNQKPHDHNRDWSDSPHWPSVAAAIEIIRKLDKQDRFDLFIDLHNPGADAKDPFYYTSPHELLSGKGRENLERFLTASRAEITGPLAFRSKVLESGRSYDDLWQSISKNWVCKNCQPHVVAVTLETAWNTPHSTTDGYRTVGRQLGQAVARYLAVSGGQVDGAADTTSGKR